LTSDQWFVKMGPLAAPAIKAVNDNRVKFVPERFSKIYIHWLENIKDWCISRQLWWGHRIPAYYCNDCGHIIVQKEEPTVCEKCGGNGFRQDEDVLDTWFSSALWPFSTLGWPEKTEELKYFYPTDVLVTGYDIIFFWVVRMVFSALEFMDDIPFEYVFIHGLVRDAEGRKMSKSLGNGIDPLEVIEEYGADALRFTLATGNTPGNDMRFHMEKLEASRNFANKLWNATRFVLMNLDDDFIDKNDISEELTLADKWIISRLNKTVKEITENMDRFELGLAVQKLYDFIWSEYCDWYIELVKPRLYGDNIEEKKTAQYTLTYVLENILKLLHPFMPFITEELWQNMPTVQGSVIAAQWPEYKENEVHTAAEENMELIMDAIRNIRNIRAEMNVVPSRKAKLIILTMDKNIAKIMSENEGYFVSLANVSEIELAENKDKVPEDAVSAVVRGAELFLPLEELIDFEKEVERLEKEKSKLESEIKRVVGKLSNEGFVNKAPARLVDEEKQKKIKYEEMLVHVSERLDSLKNR